MDFISFIPPRSWLYKNYLRVFAVLVLLLIGFLIYLNEPSQKFSVGGYVTVKSGEPLSAIASDLKVKHIIRSTTLLKSMIVLAAGEKKLVAGNYYFTRPISTFGIVSRLMKGDFEITSIRITIPEGYTMVQISNLLSDKLHNFSAEEFLKHAPIEEGYFFPDTYFFALDATTDEVIIAFHKNFEEKIKSVKGEILASGHSQKEIVTMASILEEEARTTQDWQTISSILWKRIKIGMPLQVDSTLSYVVGRISSELTTKDLKMKSPYNTYTNKGLPPTPIANPGLKTIVAAATPTSTPYLYYLSDQNGDIHYAATFAEHVQNRHTYLQ